MKSVFTILFAGFCLVSKAQSGDITLPYNTPVAMILSEDIKEGKNKVGSPTKFVAAEDVKVNGEVAIAKNAPVTGTVVTSKKGELKVEMTDVIAVDGSHVKLQDCWIYTTAFQNLKSHGALLVKGTRKNCSTADKYVIKKTAGKF